MEENIERIIGAIKKQAEAFLLGAGEFYTFATYINSKNEIVPVGAFLGDDHPQSLEVIDFLEKRLISRLENGDAKIAGLAIDVRLRKLDDKEDAIEIRFFELDNEMYKTYFKYIIKTDSVEFLTI